MPPCLHPRSVIETPDLQPVTESILREVIPEGVAVTCPVSNRARISAQAVVLGSSGQNLLPPPPQAFPVPIDVVQLLSQQAVMNQERSHRFTQMEQEIAELRPRDIPDRSSPSAIHPGSSEGVTGLPQGEGTTTDHHPGVVVGGRGLKVPESNSRRRLLSRRSPSPKLVLGLLAAPTTFPEPGKIPEVGTPTSPISEIPR